MAMYNLIEHSDKYSKKSGILWQYCKDELVVIEIVDFTEANAITALFNFKVTLTCQSDTNGTKNFEIMAPLKYLSNFWRTLEMILINCETTLDLNWFENCVVVATNMAAKPKNFH